MADIAYLKQLASKIRMNILDMTHIAGVKGAHIGGALSCADILAVLYGEVMNVDSESPLNDERDRFILSKGHVAIAHYAVLAERGFISKDELSLFEQNNSDFQTHEEMNLIKGIEISGGSLGYGVSIGVGVALNAKLLNKQYKTFVLLGDGECNEGCIWEGIISAAKFGLDNLTIIIDMNGQQLDGYTLDVMPIENMQKVCEGFGCQVICINGNDIQSLVEAFSTKREPQRPLVIIAKTIKGKGIRSIEDVVGWHHAHISDDDYKLFLHELEEV